MSEPSLHVQASTRRTATLRRVVRSRLFSHGPSSPTKSHPAFHPLLLLPHHHRLYTTPNRSIGRIAIANKQATRTFQRVRPPHATNTPKRPIVKHCNHAVRSRQPPYAPVHAYPARALLAQVGHEALVLCSRQERTHLGRPLVANTRALATVPAPVNNPFAARSRQLFGHGHYLDHDL